MAQKMDASGNPIGRTRKNIILNTHLYELEFEDVKVMKLTAKKISQSL